MLSGINPEQKYFTYEVYLLLLGTLQMVYSYYEYSDRKKMLTPFISPLTGSCSSGLFLVVGG